jgi:hypothetical protein
LAKGNLVHRELSENLVHVVRRLSGRRHPGAYVVINDWRVSVLLARAIAARLAADGGLKNQVYALLGRCEHRPFITRIIVDRLFERLREGTILPAQIGQSKLFERRDIADHRHGDLDRLVRLIHPAMQDREQEVQLFEIVRGTQQCRFVALTEHDDVRCFRHSPLAQLHLRLAASVARDDDGRVAILHRCRKLRLRRKAEGHTQDQEQPPLHLFEAPHHLKHSDVH